jgi:uncharacterized OsmC-like protein
VSNDPLGQALQRVQSVLERRPETGLHDDAPAAVRWSGGTRMVARHANGTELPTDMPAELGGTGDQVTPGWLFRAGLASCAATSIAMAAAARGIPLRLLEVKASSRSDTRGLLGMSGADGQPIYAGPDDVSLTVRIEAEGVSRERLRQLVEDGVHCSPIPSAVRTKTPLSLHIETAG